MPIRSKAALLLPLFLLMSVWGTVIARADVADPCDDPAGPGRYQNLGLPEEDYIGWADPPDDSYLCQQSNRQRASALYHCPGAEQVTVAIYSRHGCWAGWEGDRLVRGIGELPLRYCPSDGEVYCAGRRMAYDGEGMEFVFLDEEAPSGLTDYGLSISASFDGEAFFPVSCTLLSLEQEGGDTYYYEVYEAELEEGCCWVRITLTDQASIQILGREERYRFEAAGGLSLASVEIVGEEPLVEPLPEPLPEPPPLEPGPSGRPEEPPSVPEPPPGPALPDVPEEPLPPVSGGSEGEESPPWWDDGAGSEGGPLPALPPEEGERPGPGAWGPDEGAWQGEGPAFPEEREEEEGSLGQSASDGAAGQSGSAAGKQQGAGGKGGASKGEGKGGKGQAASGDAGAGETGAENEMIAGRRVVDGTTVGKEPPFWRRVLDPDVMAMLWVSALLLTVGLRLLWKE